jgi:hypothetical protein
VYQAEGSKHKSSSSSSFVYDALWSTVGAKLGTMQVPTLHTSAPFSTNYLRADVLLKTLSERISSLGVGLAVNADVAALQPTTMTTKDTSPKAFIS